MERVGVTVASRAGELVFQAIAALALGVGQRQRGLALDHGGQELLDLLGGPELRDQAARQHHRGDVGLGHQAAPELLEDQRHVDEAAAEAALLLGEGDAQPAVLAHALPGVGLPAALALPQFAESLDR